MSDVKLDTKVLDKLIKAFKGRLPVANVGVLGSKNARNGDGSNADIGAKHEFGDHTVPQRSFLRVPVQENLQKYMEKSGAFDKDALNKVAAQGSIVAWMQKVGMLAETIVLDAFDSAGFGKWVGWKNPNYKNNANQILVDTAQLRNSITSEVKE